MRIVVVERTGKMTRIRLPNGVLMNGLSAGFLSAKAKQKNISISASQLRILFRAIKRYKRTHPEWVLAEVNDHGGDTVKIML